MFLGWNQPPPAKNWPIPLWQTRQSLIKQNLMCINWPKRASTLKFVSFKLNVEELDVLDNVDLWPEDVRLREFQQTPKNELGNYFPSMPTKRTTPLVASSTNMIEIMNGPVTDPVPAFTPKQTASGTQKGAQINNIQKQSTTLTILHVSLQ